jgi:hypothetical protein
MNIHTDNAMTHTYIVLPVIAILVAWLIIRLPLQNAMERNSKMNRREVGQVAFAVVLTALAIAFSVLILASRAAQG